LQRGYRQARALIHLMGEFNQVMEFQAVLDRLSRGLSQFFAGDDVAIWIRSTGGNFELAAGVRHDVASAVGSDAARLRSVLAHGSAVIPPAWQQTERPWMAAPLLDWRGLDLGVIVLTSHRRSAYTVEDVDFLRAVLAHAAMAIQNAARFQVADRLSRLDALTGLGNRGDYPFCWRMLTISSTSMTHADTQKVIACCDTSRSSLPRRPENRAQRSGSAARSSRCCLHWRNPPRYQSPCSFVRE